MVVIDFITRRKRPARLSNQNCCVSDATVRAIDEKELAGFDWSDFETIFTMSGCTAQYDEQVYYLPYALDHVIQDQGNELLPSMVYFVARHADELRAEKLFAPCIDAFYAWFQTWTREFKIVHFDEAACRAKRWNLTHFDYVKNADNVRDLLETLGQHMKEHGLTEAMIRHLFRPGHTPEDSAWLLEIARDQNYGAERIEQIASDTTLFQRTLDELKTTLMRSATCPRYWQDVAGELALTL